VSAHPSATTALPGLIMENAQPATKDTKLKMVPVSPLKLEAQPTLDARNGTGTTKNVLNAHSDGFSTEKVSAHPSATTALPGLIMENAQPATKDTKLRMVPVSPLKLKAQPTLDARNGTGTTKNVLNAHTDGLSTPLEFAHPSVTTAPLGVTMELALLATKVTKSRMELAFCQK
jgi:hypothetical protein